jgi:hypothetical protein
MTVPRHPLLLVLAVIAAIQGLALVGYAIYDIVQGIRIGITGPAEVSNLPALLLQIVIFGALGAAMLAIALGWWRAKYGARAPFIVAQLLALVVGVPLTQAPEASIQYVGGALVVVGIIGIALALLPPVTRALLSDDYQV